MDSTGDDNLIFVYVLAPITVFVAVGVITYITIQSKRLGRQMLENGQMVNVMPAVVTLGGNHTHYRPRTEIRSPDGLPPPPPYSK